MDRLVVEVTQRLMGFTNDDTSEISVWLKSAGISEDAYRHIGEQMLGVLVSSLVEGEISFSFPPIQDSIDSCKENITASMMMAFALGWEARDQYGAN